MTTLITKRTPTPYACPFCKCEYTRAAFLAACGRCIVLDCGGFLMGKGE